MGVRSVHIFSVFMLQYIPSRSYSQRPLKAKTWRGLRRGRGWHSLVHWGCWRRWRRCLLLRRLPQGPGRPRLRTGYPRNPGSGRSGGAVVEVEGTRKRVEVRVRPGRQHYPESPVRRKRERSEWKLSSWLAKFHSIFYWEHHPTTQRLLSHELPSKKSYRHGYYISISQSVCVCVCL